MKQIRFITHDDNHVDEETLINGIWAVTRCDCELKTKENDMATYDFQYAVTMLKQAIDFAEREGDFTAARKWAKNIEEAGAELQTSVDELTKGMRLMVTMQPDSNIERAQQAAEAAEIDEWLGGLNDTQRDFVAWVTSDDEPRGDFTQPAAQYCHRMNEMTADGCGNDELYDYARGG